MTLALSLLVPYTVLAADEYWMDAYATHGQELAVANDPKINKLSDEFGQYTLVLQCSGCGHERHTQPHTLARLCGFWCICGDI